MSREVESREDREIRGEAERLLAFSVGNEQFAIPLQVVKQVIAVPVIRPVPETPPHFKGIMNLRGDVFSVIDLRIKLKAAKTEQKADTGVIIVDLCGISVGLIVDSIDCVFAIVTSELKQISSIQHQTKSEFIRGVAERDKRLVLVLELEKLLESDRGAAVRQPSSAKAA